MSTELTKRQTAPTLPAPMRNELRIIRDSPKQYLEELRPEKADDPRPASVPTLSQIRRVNGFANVIAVLTLAIHEVKEWFNVKNNITHDQEALTAELILDDENLYDLTLGNIKACFRQRMKSEKLYDRLDGNIIISWLRQFKSDMAEHCETVNEGKDRIRQREESAGDAGAITHATYMAMLEARANDGDKEAKAILDDYRRRARIKSNEQTREDEIRFQRYKLQYLKKKGLIK